MEQLNPQQRDILIHRYVQALENGDMEAITPSLEAAEEDAELARIIEEINRAYYIEEFGDKKSELHRETLSLLESYRIKINKPS